MCWSCPCTKVYYKAFVSGLVVVAWNHFFYMLQKKIHFIIHAHTLMASVGLTHEEISYACWLIDWLMGVWCNIIFKSSIVIFLEYLKLFWEYRFTSNFSPLNFISKSKNLVVFEFWKEVDHEVAPKSLDSINLSKYLLLGTYFVYKSFKQ
jgi:hypothetical protein